jgi:acyl-CoA thioester hydrolase
MIVHTTLLRPRYADTDQMKFVYYGKYFEYFEQARSELLRSIGVTYSEIESHGYLLPVVEASAKYRRPVHYDEEIRIETTLAEMPVARIRLDYKIFRGAEPDPVAEGYTVHSFINAATGKPTRAPAFVLHVIEDAMKRSHA